MYEYIILEDFKMNKYIYDDKNGLWYELQGDNLFLVLHYQPKKKINLLACEQTEYIPC